MNVQEQIEKLRVRRAAEWLEIMTGGEPSEGECEGFSKWMAESPLNSSAFLKLSALSRQTMIAARDAGLRPGAVSDSRDSVVSLGVAPASEQTIAAPHRDWIRRSAGLAAAIGVVGIGAFLYMERFSNDQFTQSYVTTAGDEKTLRLPDGSTIYLNAVSNAHVRFTPHARDIDLEGEALFDVAKDAQRPFQVRTRDAVVRAIGTQFNVATGATGTRVAVKEGRVQVAKARPLELVSTTVSRTLSSAEPTSLGAGEAALVVKAGNVERQPAEEAVKALAWREHLLIFDGTSLEEAVAEFNRYQTSMRVRMEDVAPRSHHYSGIFNAKDPASFADFLSREQDLIVEKNEKEIVIRGRP